jgi:g-D-glutamyl-meso-diaminopimelate peptidase
MNDTHNDGFPNNVVPTNVPFTSAVLEDCVRRLASRYPFLRACSAGKSVMGRDLWTVTIGEGSKEVFYNAAHHANEWITAPVLMRFLEDYAEAAATGRSLCGVNAGLLYRHTALTALPMVNPDGVDLVAGMLTSGAFFDAARTLAESKPEIPFPSGWKANIRGVDLNLQYPAGWENAREIKAALGVTGPGPRDYPGPGPLSEPESRAVYELTRRHDFALTLSLHTQGKTIYWKYLDIDIKNAYQIAEKFGGLSGYEVEETPLASGYAGYKDWFIASFGRPGFTIEAGEGVSPLPLGQFQEIYGACLGILTYGLAAALSESSPGFRVDR